MMTMTRMMIRLRIGVITSIVAPSASPMVPNATLEMNLILRELMITRMMMRRVMMMMMTHIMMMITMLMMTVLTTIMVAPSASPMLPNKG